MDRHTPFSGATGPKRAAVSHGERGRRSALNRLRRDSHGGTAVMTAIALTSLLGAAGLAADAGGAYLLRRNMQAAADAAAMAGATNYEKSKNVSSTEAVARSVASRNGFTQGANGTAVTPAVELGTPDRVTVSVQRNASRFLLDSSFGAKVVSARAVAVMVDAGAKPCVTTLSGSISVGNNTSVTAGGCALVSNSSSASAFCLGTNCNGNGSGQVTAAAIVTQGGCEGCAGQTGQGGKLTLTRSDAPLSYASATPNPYSDLNSWSPPSGSTNNCVNRTSSALTQGCYNSIRLQPNDTVTMEPGVYYIRSGDLEVKGTLTCPKCSPSNGVSIVLVGNGSSAPGRVIVGSQGIIDLNASVQNTTALSGVLVYRHHPGGSAPANAGNNCGIDIGAGAQIALDGAIVAPTSCVSMGGNSQTSPDSCNVFVVASMDFRGNSNLSAEGCRFYGTELPVPRIPRLVE